MQRVGDQAEIDDLVAGFFAAFDNRNGLAPDPATLLGFFSDKAVIARISGPDIQFYDPMEFALPRIELLVSGALVAFHEAETSSTTRIAGPVATRTSRYRKAGMLNGSPYTGAGTKTFQLVALDAGWRILSLAWIDDAAEETNMATKLPGELTDGAHCTVVGGTHAGKSGTVADIKTSKTGHVTITVVQKDGARFKTLAKHVVVSGRA